VQSIHLIFKPSLAFVRRGFQIECKLWKICESKFGLSYPCWPALDGPKLNRLGVGRWLRCQIASTLQGLHFWLVKSGAFHTKFLRNHGFCAKIILHRFCSFNTFTTNFAFTMEYEVSKDRYWWELRPDARRTRIRSVELELWAKNNFFTSFSFLGHKSAKNRFQAKPMTPSWSAENSLQTRLNLQKKLYRPLSRLLEPIKKRLLTRPEKIMTKGRLLFKQHQNEIKQSIVRKDVPDASLSGVHFVWRFAQPIIKRDYLCFRCEYFFRKVVT
jgi:hypothetical protein